MSTNKWVPSEGVTIKGRYEITGHLGEGGIAKVWRAVDDRNGRGVAVKHILFEGRNYDRKPGKIEEMFRNEVEALRDVKNAGGHPNIIELYDAVSIRGTQLAVVELVEGDELEEGLSLSHDEARRIAIKLADAMAFLHRNEIIYRDLKPDNAMIQTDGSPKLIDFNTAKGIDADIENLITCPNCGNEDIDGTDYACSDCGIDLTGEAKDTQIGGAGGDIYKPPESTEDLGHFRQGPWSDVYSLGKLLFYMLDPRDNPNAIPGSHGMNPNDFPNIDLDPSNQYLGEVVERATERDYESRYSNAHVFQTVLENEDPEPPTQARLIHEQTGREYQISPGDTIGRQGADGPAATITIDDPGGNYISAVQLQFDVDDRDNWVLRDQSLNGSYVQQGNGWQRVLCEHGRRRLHNKGHPPTDQHGNVPPEELELEDGATIALVHTEYDAVFQFEEVM